MASALGAGLLRRKERRQAQHGQVSAAHGQGFALARQRMDVAGSQAARFDHLGQRQDVDLLAQRDRHRLHDRQRERHRHGHLQRPGPCARRSPRCRPATGCCAGPHPCRRRGRTRRSPVPRWKIPPRTAAATPRHRSRRPAGFSPRLAACARMSSRSSPRPSSLTSITTLPPRWLAARLTVPTGGLPAATRASGVSSPWSTALRTRCVSGSDNLLDQPAIELGGFARGRQFDPLAQARGQLAHQPRKAARTRRRSAPSGSRAPFPAGRACAAPDRPGPVARRVPGILFGQRALARQHRFGDHQLAHQVHQQVDLLGRHADRTGAIGGWLWAPRRCAGRPPAQWAPPVRTPRPAPPTPPARRRPAGLRPFRRSGVTNSSTAVRHSRRIGDRHAGRRISRACLLAAPELDGIDEYLVRLFVRRLSMSWPARRH